MTETKARNKKRSNRPVVFDMTSNQCVWAKAGVIKPVMCINAFDCITCAMDTKIKSDLEAGKLKDKQGQAAVSWQHPKHWTKLGPNQRKCRHMLTGHVSYKNCARGFECSTCPYDQMIEESMLAQPVGTPNVDLAGGFNVPQDYYFHRGHAWARVEYGGRIRIGLDDFALKLLGPVDEFRLPGLGDTVRQSEPETGLTRGENEAITLSPVDGVVVATNPKVLDKATTANESPYEDGWLMVIQPAKMRNNLKNLLFGEEGTAFIEEESGRLSAMVAEETGYPLAATGGEVVSDIYGAAPELGWNNLVDNFLKI